ncbi:MJ0042-type zinc finger domain-containing protein [uncultured Gimesia sp.]|uniref:MJ0042-type zinc finger domain-containing protein n=1 Tax=uncultured Gimesia sp. TaxID=1678688 RepID=UPI0030D92AC4|tara:strand:+ start:94699 stop:97128 length:2430 start_codon:yes stop_codon:yes gene_type:complete
MSETFVIQCPHCGASFKAKSKAALGKKVPCPKCQTPFVVAAPKSAPPKVKKKQKPASLPDAWDDEDLSEEGPVHKARSTGKPQRSGKRSNKKQSAGTTTIVAGLLVIGVLVGGGILFLSSNSNSSDQKAENLALEQRDVSEQEAIENEPGETPVMKAQSSDVSPASNPTTKLSFKIVAIHENLGKIIRYTKNPNTNEEKQIKQAEGVAERSLGSTLGDKFLNQISFLDVDLKKKELSFSMRNPIPDNLIQAINSVSFQMVSVAPLNRSLHEELIEKHGADKLIVHELEYHLSNIIPEYKKQLEENFEQGSKALYQALSQQLEQSVPEYIPNSLKLDLEYKILTFQVIQPPASNLGLQINHLPNIPLLISPSPDREREVRTEKQKKHVQVTYQILDDYGVTKDDGQENLSYNFHRNMTLSELSEILYEKVLGFIPGTLDVSFPKKTVTFQMDHLPDDDLGTKISAMMNHRKLSLSAKPLSVGPPAPPFRTPGRPMYFVVLKVLTVKDPFNEYHRDQQPEMIKKYLTESYRIINNEVEGVLGCAIKNSARIDPDRMYVAVQIDRVPPDDLAKQINGAPLFHLVLADEIVSMQKIEYDPESTEKTLYFQFIDHGDKLPQFDHRFIKQATNGNLCGIDRYIPGSLNIDFEQGLFDIKVRVGGNEKEEIEYAVGCLKGIQLEVTHLKTVPPQGTKKSDPTGIGIVSTTIGADSTGASTTMNTPATVSPGQNMKVTIQFGLYSGKGKLAKSARDVLDGFSWVDLKSFKVDAAKKEISFNTTGPMNEAALDRLLKRQKFYQCVVKKEALPEEAAKE